MRERHRKAPSKTFLIPKYLLKQLQKCDKLINVVFNSHGQLNIKMNKIIRIVKNMKQKLRNYLLKLEGLYSILCKFIKPFFALCVVTKKELAFHRKTYVV